MTGIVDRSQLLCEIPAMWLRGGARDFTDISAVSGAIQENCVRGHPYRRLCLTTDLMLPNREGSNPAYRPLLDHVSIWLE